MLLHHLGKKEIIAKTTREKKNTKKKEIVDDATPCRYLVFSTNFFYTPNSLSWKLVICYNVKNWAWPHSGLLEMLQKRESSTAHNHGCFFFSPFFFTSKPSWKLVICYNVKTEHSLSLNCVNWTLNPKEMLQKKSHQYHHGWPILLASFLLYLQPSWELVICYNVKTE